MNNLSSIFNNQLWNCLLVVTMTMGSSLSYASSAICSTATEYGGAFTVNDSTDLESDDFNLDAELDLCFGSGDASDQFVGTGLGPDNVVAFVSAGGSNDVLVSLHPDSVDLALYIVTDCDDIDGSCVWVSDGGGTGDSETILFDAEAGMSYYIIVDGFAGAFGTYELTLEPFSIGPPDVVYMDFNAPAQGDGTWESPIRTLNTALSVVGGGGTIRIVGDSAVTFSNETFTGASKINQNVTIDVAPKGSGQVSVGGDASADAAPSDEAAEGSESGYVTRRAR